MTLYFDTSALAKYFHNEAGSATVIQLIDDKANAIWISELAITEFLSAFHRRLRLGEINSNVMNDVVTAFETLALGWNIEPISTLQIEEANKIIKAHGKKLGIRTLDALHLAAFNLLNQNDWKFVVADKQLNNVASVAGIDTLFIQ